MFMAKCAIHPIETLDLIALQTVQLASQRTTLHSSVKKSQKHRRSSAAVGQYSCAAFQWWWLTIVYADFGVVKRNWKGFVCDLGHLPLLSFLPHKYRINHLYIGRTTLPFLVGHSVSQSSIHQYVLWNTRLIAVYGLYKTTRQAA